MELKPLILIFLGAALVNNYVLVKFLGICPFVGVSKKVETSIGMGLAVIFVMVLAGSVTWGIQKFILVPNHLEYLQTIAFILVIASLVQFVEMFLKKFVPVLYQALGVFLPLITTNCAVLGVSILNIQLNYTLVQTIVNCFGAGAGFTIALLLMAGIRERLEFADVPRSLEGVPITFITAGLMAIAFMGFTAMI